MSLYAYSEDEKEELEKKLVNMFEKIQGRWGEGEGNLDFKGSASGFATLEIQIKQGFQIIQDAQGESCPALNNGMLVAPNSLLYGSNDHDDS